MVKHILSISVHIFFMLFRLIFAALLEYLRTERPFMFTGYGYNISFTYNDNTNYNCCFPGKDVVGLIKHGTLSP